MTLALDISGAPVNFDNRTPKPKPVASYDPEKQILTILNGYSVKEVLRADGFKWQPACKTWNRTMALDELKAAWSLYKSVGIIPSAKTATLVDGAEVQTEKPAPSEPEPTLEGWLTITPTSITKLKRAREIAMLLADATLPHGKGMRVGDPEDRALLRQIACIIREAIIESAGNVQPVDSDYNNELAAGAEWA